MQITALHSHAPASAGEIVYWSMFAAPAARVEAMLAAVTAANPSIRLPTPGTMTQGQAIAAALAETRGPDEGTRPLRGGGEHTLATRTVPDATAPTGARVEIIFRVVPAGDDVTLVWEAAPDADREAAFRAAYARARDTIGASQWGEWLATAARAAQAVRLRDNGGVYYVPPHRRDNWRLCAAIARQFGRVYTIPAMAGDDAAAAVLDALAEDCAAAVADASGVDLTTASDRALAARTARFAAIREKVTAYARAFGPAVDKIRAAVDAAEAGQADTIMVMVSEASQAFI